MQINFFSKTVFLRIVQSIILVNLIFPFFGFGQNQYTITPNGGWSASTTDVEVESPIFSNSNSMRFQFVYTTSELNLGGMIGPTLITRLAWNNLCGSDLSLNNYTIKLSNTSAIDCALHNFDNTTIVKSSFTYNPEFGWDDIVFDIPFTWDGTSNLLVEICSDANDSLVSGGVQINYDIPNGSRSISSNSSVCSSSTNQVNPFKPYIRFTEEQLCSNPINAGITLTSDTLSCGGVNFTLSISNQNNYFGISYQWQSSTDGINFNNIVGANTSVFSTQQNSSTYYQCVVSCFSGGSSVSTPVFIQAGTYAQCFCTPSPANVLGEGIVNVTFGSINNSTSSEVNNYGNYTSLSTDIQQGFSASISISFQLTNGLPVFNPQITKIWVDWNDNGSFYDVGDQVFYGVAYNHYQTISYNFIANFNIPLNAPIGQHVMRIGISNSELSPCAVNGFYGAYEDYTLNVLMPPCLNPTLLSGFSSNYTEAAINWTEPTISPSNGYVYFVSTSLATLNTNSIPTGATADTSIYLTGLLPYTNYFVYVASVCDNGDLSFAPSPIAISTYPCIPNSNPYCPHNNLIQRVILNSLNNFSGVFCANVDNGFCNFATGTSNAGSSTTTSLISGSQYDCSVIFSGFMGIVVWIDYNNNMLFENTEIIGQSAGLLSGQDTLSFSFEVPCNLAPGNYALRVRGQFIENGELITPCNNSLSGETEDYLISIQAPVICPVPIELSASNPTATSVNLSWQIGCSNSNVYEIEYGLSGFSNGTGILISSIQPAISNQTANFVVTNLEPNAIYDFYVRSNCDTLLGDYSDWSLPTTDTTFCISAGIQYNNLTGELFSLDENAISYEWIECSDPNTVLDSSMVFTPSFSGNFALITSDSSGCQAISDCYDLTSLEVNYLDINSIQIIPNPSNGIMVIEAQGVADHNFVIYSMEGRKLQAGTLTNGLSVLDLQSFANGTYIFQTGRKQIRFVIQK